MSKSSFVFDLNRCVGCMACVVGCSIENQGLQHHNWREVSTLNPLRHPDLPVFHFSLACNHCEDAPWMRLCPALAYTRDTLTGAVIHHAEACIGCTYCTWTCPYDAPKFNKTEGIVEKCDFCTDRLKAGAQPACVDACPVAALSFDPAGRPEDEAVVPGFARYDIRPSIIIKPLRDNTLQPKTYNLDQLAPDQVQTRQLMPPPPGKVKLKKEWVLVIFTLLAAALSGIMWAHIQSGFPLNPVVFVSIGILGLLLSSVHLGRKLRAWRSVLNLRHSWLSREIVSYASFLGLGTLYLLKPNEVLDILTILAAMMVLISIDGVYLVLTRQEKMRSHSALVILTGIMIFSFLSGITYLALATVALKVVLYLYRKIRYLKLRLAWRPLMSIVRLAALALVPLTVIYGWIFNPYLTLLIVALGEITDRAEFYLEADVNQPKTEINILLQKYIHEKEKRQ